MKKFVGLLLSLIILVMAGMSVGCGKKTAADTEQTLEVFCLDAGYGTKWLSDALDMFKEEDWVKEKYPSLEITTKFSALQDQAYKYMNNGSELNTIDLFFDTYMCSTFVGPSGDCIDLNEPVFNAEVPGEEGVLVKDKMTADILESLIDKTPHSKGDNRYCFPWQNGISGIIYNETKLNEKGIAVPKTTDELISAVEAFADPEQKNGPIATWGVSTYWTYIYDLLWGQYSGAQAYSNYWQGIADNIEKNIEIFSDIGRLKAMEVVYDLLSKKENVWMCQTVDRSNFIETQTRLLRGQSIFMANGTWFHNEMKGVEENLKNAGFTVDTVKMMQTPVISSITELLNYSSMTDAELSKIIGYIDLGKTYDEIKGEFNEQFTQDDFDIILDARMTQDAGGGVNAFGFIPKYAKAKDVACDFLRYMATDKVSKQYVRATDGAKPCFKFDIEQNKDVYDECSVFSKSVFEITDLHPYADRIINISGLSYPLYTNGGLKSVRTTKVNTVGQACTERNKQGELIYGSANEIFEAVKSFWANDNQYNWKQALDKAGLN